MKIKEQNFKFPFIIANFNCVYFLIFNGFKHFCESGLNLKHTICQILNIGSCFNYLISVEINRELANTVFV